MNKMIKSNFQSKNHHRFKREQDKLFKEKEIVKNKPYQKICDSYKKNLKKKGIGKTLKIKGQTQPKFMCTNSKCVKSWTMVGYGRQKPLKEGMKLFTIFSIT